MKRQSDAPQEHLGSTGGPVMWDGLDLTAELKPFQSKTGDHVFVVDGSRIYDLDHECRSFLDRAFAQNGQANAQQTAALWHALGLSRESEHRYIGGNAIDLPKVRSISLNLAQTCNMACRYCYADEGHFGGRARLMGEEVALATVDRLFLEAEPDARMVLGFMGGEPLLARDLLHRTARYAWEKARREGRDIRFSLTTNGTLIREADAELFRDLPFTVTFSIDGTRDVHDLLRPMKNGGGSYDAMISGLETIERVGRPLQLAARATVTARTGRLLPLLDHMIELGFDDVGFSPVLVSPDPKLAFSAADFQTFLSHMIECGEKALREIKAGRSYPFGNLESALQEIHRGTHRPFPCGAGAGYLSANAEGKLFACHRLIDDPAFAMGDVRNGSDEAARSRHLSRSHVDLMEPCKRCWARYLCGGGCYHEVKARGRLACDYIRGWLEFCLCAYVELSNEASALAPVTGMPETINSLNKVSSEAAVHAPPSNA